MGLTILDAAVLVAVLDPDHAHHAAAVRALRAARSREDSLVVPVSAYAECLVWPFRDGATAVARVEAFVDKLPWSWVQRCRWARTGS